MTEEEVRKLYIRLTFQCEPTIDTLLTKELIDADIAIVAKEKFYDSLNEEKLWTVKRIRDYHETICLYMRQMTCNDMVSLTELVRQYSEEPPGYVIQTAIRWNVYRTGQRQWCK